MRSGCLPSVFSTFANCFGWLTSQSFCGARRMRAPFAPPRLSEPRNVDADAQAVETSCETDKPGREDFALQRGDFLRADQFVIHRGNGVLPDEFFFRDLRSEITRARAHVAVRQLEPRPGERIGELIGILQEAPRNLFVGRVEPQRRGPWSAWSADASSTDRARPESLLGRPWRPTDARRPGFWSIPIRNRTGSRRNNCSTSSASASR